MVVLFCLYNTVICKVYNVHSVYHIYKENMAKSFYNTLAEHNIGKYL